MARPDESHITRIDTGSQLRFMLPPRPLGRIRWFGLLPIGFAFLFSGFAVFWTLSAAGVLGGGAGPLSWSRLLFAAFGVPFILAGLVPAWIGLAVLIGRNEIELRDGTLISIERVGPLPWKRRRPIANIETLEVLAGGRMGRQQNDPVEQVTRWSDLAALRATGPAMKMLVVAWGYPKDLLLQLATELADRCDAQGPTHGLNAPGPIDIVERRLGVEDGPDPGPGGADETVPEQPASSRIHLERHDAGLTLTLPALGIRQGSKGLFGFGVIWCVIMAAITVPVVLSDDFRDGPWLPILFGAGFWAVGIGLLLAGINMGRRRAIVDVIKAGPDSTLLISRQNLFGTKQHQMPRSQIAAIRVDNSGMEVNKVPVKNLQIHPTTGKKLGLFAGREDRELEWMAAALRKELDAPRR